MRLRIVVALLVLAATPVLAQIHYFPPSVTSMGPRGQLAPMPFPSVTSMGPLGFRGNPFLPPNQQIIRFHHHFGHRPQAFPLGAVPIYVPYAYPYFYLGYGPDYGTVGSDMAVPAYAPYPYPMIYPAYGMAANGVETAQAFSAPSPRTPQPAPEAASAQPAGGEPAAKQPAPAPDNASEQEPTVLVFRDGHRLTIHNYAIVGSSLYNLSGKGPRKIELASLDLDSTVRVNDERGVVFRVPGNGGN